MSTASDLEAALADAVAMFDAIAPFTPAAEFVPLVNAAAMLAKKIADAANAPTAQSVTDVAVTGIEAAVDAEEIAKFPNPGGHP